MNKKTLTHLTLIATITLSSVSAAAPSQESSSSSEKAKKSSDNATSSPHIIANPPLLSASTSSATSTLVYKEVRKTESKLQNLAPEQREMHMKSKAGSSSLNLFENLLASSLKTERNIAAVETFVNKQSLSIENKGQLEKNLSEAKLALSTANNSLTTMSSILENLTEETSTSTYKKALILKKKDLTDAASAAKQNIVSTNTILKQILATVRQSIANEGGIISIKQTVDEKPELTPFPSSSQEIPVRN